MTPRRARDGAEEMTLKEAADAVLFAARNLVDIQDATPRGAPYSIEWHNRLNEAARVYTGLWWKRSRAASRGRWSK